MLQEKWVPRSEEMSYLQKRTKLKKKNREKKFQVPRQHYSIHDMDENEIGEVTSGTQSPSLGIPIGMGYVPKEIGKVGTRLKVKFGKKFLEAEIVKLPFYKK